MEAWGDSLRNLDAGSVTAADPRPTLSRPGGAGESKVQALRFSLPPLPPPAVLRLEHRGEQLDDVLATALLETRTEAHLKDDGHESWQSSAKCFAKSLRASQYGQYGCEPAPLVVSHALPAMVHTEAQDLLRHIRQYCCHCCTLQPLARCAPPSTRCAPFGCRLRALHWRQPSNRGFPGIPCGDDWPSSCRGPVT